MILLGRFLVKFSMFKYGAIAAWQRSAKASILGRSTHPGKWTLGRSAIISLSSEEDPPSPQMTNSQGVVPLTAIFAASCTGLKSKAREWLPTKQTRGRPSSKIPCPSHQRRHFDRKLSFRPKGMTFSGNNYAEQYCRCPYFFNQAARLGTSGPPQRKQYQKDV